MKIKLLPVEKPLTEDSVLDIIDGIPAVDGKPILEIVDARTIFRGYHVIEIEREILEDYLDEAEGYRIRRVRK